jgi:hypothetical protein
MFWNLQLHYQIYKNLDPCKGVVCNNGLSSFSSSGVCQCLCNGVSCDGDSNICLNNACVCGGTGGKCTGDSNRCENNACVCGSTRTKCTTSTTPACLIATGAFASGDSSATCQVQCYCLFFCFSVLIMKWKIIYFTNWFIT